MRLRSTRCRLVAAALALSLVAAACGDDEEEGPDAAADTTAGETATETTTPTGGEGDGAGETEGEGGAGGGGWAVDTGDCPDDATEALPEGEPIRIATSIPQSGPFAGFGLLGPGLQAAFDKANAAGGIAGHQIEFSVADDGYEPARTVTNVQRFLDEEDIFATILQVGSPNVEQSRDLFADACVPQLLVGTGDELWGDVENYPWTVGALMPYDVEANIWFDHIAEEFPDGARVGMLIVNNGFGRNYQEAFAAAVEERGEEAGIELVSEQLHEFTAPPGLLNEVTNIVSATPDVILGATSAARCGELMASSRQAGYDGMIIVSTTCSSQSFFLPAGEAANGVRVIVSQKDPADPQWADDPAVQQYREDMAQFAPQAPAQISVVGTGYNVGTILVDMLQMASEMEGGLTRANLLNVSRNWEGAGPLTWPGIVPRTAGEEDAYFLESGQMTEYQLEPGAPAGTFSEIGELTDLDGEKGVFEE